MLAAPPPARNGVTVTSSTSLPPLTDNALPAGDNDENETLPGLNGHLNYSSSLPYPLGNSETSDNQLISSSSLPYPDGNSERNDHIVIQPLVDIGEKNLTNNFVHFHLSL